MQHPHETGLTAFLSFAASFLFLLSVHSCRRLADTCRKNSVQAANQPRVTEMRIGSNPDWVYSVQRPTANTVTIRRGPFRPFIHLFIYSGFVLLSGSIFCRLPFYSLFLVCCHFLSLSLNYSVHIISTFKLHSNFNISRFYFSKRYAPFLSSSLNPSNQALPFHRAHALHTSHGDQLKKKILTTHTHTQFCPQSLFLFPLNDSRRNDS